MKLKLCNWLAEPLQKLDALLKKELHHKFDFCFARHIVYDIRCEFLNVSLSPKSITKFGEDLIYALHSSRSSGCRKENLTRNGQFPSHKNGGLLLKVAKMTMMVIVVLILMTVIVITMMMAIIMTMIVMMVMNNCERCIQYTQDGLYAVNH